MSVVLQFKKLHPNAKLPTVATSGSACFDFYAIEGTYLDQGFSVDVPLGLACEVPPGFALLIFSRSGHGFKHGVSLRNAVGVIDSDYRGELKVAFHMELLDGSRSYPPQLHIYPGDRIAQGMLIELPKVRLMEVDELSETERGAGGFGSTGR